MEQSEKSTILDDSAQSDNHTLEDTTQKQGQGQMILQITMESTDQDPTIKDDLKKICGPTPS